MPKVKRWDVTETVYAEIAIEIRFEGEDDPGRITGLPENCYPPNFDDERTITSITIGLGVYNELNTDPRSWETLCRVFDPIVKTQEIPDE